MISDPLFTVLGFQFSIRLPLTVYRELKTENAR